MIISGLLAEEIERQVAAEDEWLRAERSALALLINRVSIREVELPLRGMNCTSVTTFVDTNILIYGHDADAGAKYEAANGILLSSGVLSIQVLQELYVHVTRKIRTPLPKSLARTVVEDYALWCIATTPVETSAAFRIEDETGISFWDALIIASARKSGCCPSRGRGAEFGPGHRRGAYREPILLTRGTITRKV